MKKVFSLICVIALLFGFSIPAMAVDNGDVSVIGVNTQVADSESTDRVIVKFEDGTSASVEVAVNGTCSVEDVERVDSDSFVVEPEAGVSAESVAQEYKDKENVEYAEPDYLASALDLPNDTYYSNQQAAFDTMSVTNGWEISQGSSSVIIAVIDTGIDYNHPDLVGKILSNGYDFVNKDADPMDDNGHGTMCAGVIGALINNVEGVAGVSNCMILPIKVLDSAGNGYTSDIASGITYAVDNGARVISMSLGCLSLSKTMQAAVDYAYSRGVTIVAASGNINKALMYPAGCTTTIAVGAVKADGTRATYSCYGNGLDVMAVGSNVFTTYSKDGSYSYAYASGTSLACPYVSGLAGIMLTLNPTMTPDAILSTIETTATDAGDPGFDVYNGYGIVNYYTALSAVSGTSEKDTTAPVITLNGMSSVYTSNGSVYNDLGATAVDDKDGDITSKIITSNTVDTAVDGVYTVTYSVADDAGNSTSATRTVTVSSNERPVVSLNGSSTVTVAKNGYFADTGATAFDKEDGDISSSIVVSGSVNTANVGTYAINYDVTDSQGLPADTVIRTVIVNENTKPVISLNGSSTVYCAIGKPYKELGATANDTEDGDISSSVSITGTVNTAKAGAYTLTYSVVDSQGLVASPVTRTVIVKKNSAPVLTLNGSARVIAKFNKPYEDLGAIATDSEDGDLTDKIVVTGSVNTAKSGSYKLTYTITDSTGATITKVRTIYVPANTAPKLSLIGAYKITIITGTEFVDPGVKATDAEDGDLTAGIQSMGEINTSTAGTYKVVYTVTDSSGVKATVTRIVVVKANAAPTLTLRSSATIRLKVGAIYKEYGATARDTEDGVLTANIVITSNVDMTKVGTYTVTYTVTDSYGATTMKTRTIVVS